MGFGGVSLLALKEELDTVSDYGHFSSWRSGQQGGKVLYFLMYLYKAT